MELKWSRFHTWSDINGEEWLEHFLCLVKLESCFNIKTQFYQCSTGNSMLKERRPTGRLSFNTELPRRKDKRKRQLYIETWHCPLPGAIVRWTEYEPTGTQSYIGYWGILIKILKIIAMFVLNEMVELKVMWDVGKCVREQVCAELGLMSPYYVSERVLVMISPWNYSRILLSPCNSK